MSFVSKNTNGKRRDLEISPKRVRGPTCQPEFTEEYPPENPENALQDITRALAYAGVFNGIN
jgi:hypothetical protein